MLGDTVSLRMGIVAHCVIGHCMLAHFASLRSVVLKSISHSHLLPFLFPLESFAEETGLLQEKTLDLLGYDAPKRPSHVEVGILLVDVLDWIEIGIKLVDDRDASWDGNILDVLQERGVKRCVRSLQGGATKSALDLINRHLSEEREGCRAPPPSLLRSTAFRFIHDLTSSPISSIILIKPRRELP